MNMSIIPYTPPRNSGLYFNQLTGELQRQRPLSCLICQEPLTPYRVFCTKHSDCPSCGCLRIICSVIEGSHKIWCLHLHEAPAWATVYYEGRKQYVIW